MNEKTVMEYCAEREKYLAPLLGTLKLKPRPNTARERNKLRRALFRLEARQLDITKALAKMMAETGRWCVLLSMEPEEDGAEQREG